MTNAFETAGIDVVCTNPACGKTNRQFIAKLVTSNAVPCLYCDLPIKLESEDVRAFIKTAAEFYRKQRVIRC